ncbi:MAG: tetratricopeptide repeat protein [Acetobacteraceae bacterium]|nr:tetratricopeptide repeat protein [Acetobacteraceae bacterium]
MSRRKHQIDAGFQQARRFHAAGRLAEAERVYRQILAAVPEHADTVAMLGVLALQTGHPADALTCSGRAIALKPSNAMYHVNRAGALLALGRALEAEAVCREALRLKRNSAEAYQTLGHACSDLGRPQDAIAAYREAIRQNPSLPDIHSDLGLALREADQLEAAVQSLTEAARRAPGDLLITGNLAGVLKDLGDLSRAEACYRNILRRRPDDAAAHFNLGILLLLAGRFGEAWSEWEWRFRAGAVTTSSVDVPLWTGGALNGRTLLIQAEQGIGDMIQFCRFLPLLPREGRVVLETHAPLVRLLSQLKCVDQVIAIGDCLPGADVRCPMMSLPGLLGISSEAAIPRNIPYLSAHPDCVAGWRDRLGGLAGLRVGLVWAGNPERSRMDRKRSVALQRLACLAEVPGVTLVSVQKGPAAAEVSQFAGTVHDCTAELTDFADTAGLVAALDLVIGVDTAVVHLAGALGKPVWLLNRSDTCWRWLLGREDSPWYSTLRQFRQTSAGAWDEVIARVCGALAAKARDHR